MLDDWTAPKGLRFGFKRRSRYNMKTFKQPLEPPITAELSHLGMAGKKLKLGEVLPQQAALFLLAEQMVLTGCTWLEECIPDKKR